MREHIIQKQARFFLIILIAYSAIFPVFALGGLLNYSFFNPELMINNQYTSGHVDEAMRWKHFLAWLPTNITGMLACFTGVYLTYLARSGRFFTRKFASGLKLLGIFVLLSGLFDLAAASVIPRILSALNPAGLQPINFRFAPEELGLCLCGIGFMALGNLMEEATRLSEENKEFV